MKLFINKFFCHQLYDINDSYWIQIISSELSGYKYCNQIITILWIQEIYSV